MANKKKLYNVVDENGNVIHHGVLIEKIADIYGLSVNYLRKCASNRRRFLNKYMIIQEGTVMKERVNPDDIDYEEIHKKYLNGESLEKIATEVGITSRTLKTRFHRRGWKTRTRAESVKMLVEKGVIHEREPSQDGYMFHRTITDLGKVRALRNAGWSKRQIAEEFVSNEEEVKRCLDILKMK